MSDKERFNEEERKQILDAIARAEKSTSGEIRLFVEDNCGDNVLDRAAFIFSELGMNKTLKHNGVLFYLALKSHQFAILGDKGINSRVEKDFWHEIKLAMQMYFSSGDFVKGLTIGIEMAGEALKSHFPYQEGDKNELSDDIVFG